MFDLEMVAMDDGFDPYYEWLGIPRRDQPPNWYRLLGIEQFEENANVIERAADRQMGHLRTFQTGAHARDSQRLLNEVSAARVGLLSPERKAVYDEQLRAEALAAFPAFELPPQAPPAAPPIASVDPPPQAVDATPAAATPAPPPAGPIAAPLRTRRTVRRRKSLWKQPALWGLVLLLLLAAALGYASMVILDLPQPAWLAWPNKPPTP